MWLVVNRHLRTSASAASYRIDADHGAVHWRLWSLRLEYIATPNLSASTFIQHDSSTDSTFLNARLRWILPNDSDLFLVYNESEIDETGIPVRRRRELALKVSWRFFL